MSIFSTIKLLPIVLVAVTGCRAQLNADKQKANQPQGPQPQDQVDTTVENTASTPIPKTDPKTPAPSSPQQPSPPPAPTPSGGGDPITLEDPKNINDGERNGSLTATPTVSWDPVDGAASYELAVGSSPGAANIAGWRDVGSTTTAVLTAVTLPNAAILYASVRAVTASGTKGPSASGDGWQNLLCPTYWVKVPGNTTPNLGGGVYSQGTRTRHDGSTRDLSDFCVMKYEMKLHDGTSVVADGNNANTINYNAPGSIRAVSHPDGRPWVRIQRENSSLALDAQRACSNIGGQGIVDSTVDAHFYLINNAQWQAIARNIESDARNKSSSVYNRGHTDGDASLAASSDDAQGCYGYVAGDTHNNIAVSQTCEDAWHLNKRTHILTNDEVIWDLAGNVWEWLIDNVGVGQQINPDPDLSNLLGDDFNSDDYTSTACTGPCFSLTGTNRLAFGPANDIDASNGIGVFTGAMGTYGGSLARGGQWWNSVNAGVFHASVSNPPTLSMTSVGARCVWAP